MRTALVPALLCLAWAAVAAGAQASCPPLGPAIAPTIAGNRRCVELIPGMYAHWSVTPASGSKAGSITFVLDVMPSKAAVAGTSGGAMPGGMRNLKWFALGLSPTGSMKGADVYVLEK